MDNNERIFIQEGGIGFGEILRITVGHAKPIVEYFPFGNWIGVQLPKPERRDRLHTVLQLLPWIGHATSGYVMHTKLC